MQALQNELHREKLKQTLYNVKTEEKIKNVTSTKKYSFNKIQESKKCNYKGCGGKGNIRASSLNHYK